MIKHRAKIDSIIKLLNAGEFLHFRNYREEQSDLEIDFWEIMCMIIMSTKIGNESDGYCTPKEFQDILAIFFDHIFLNRVKTQDAIREIPRKAGLNRAYWKDFKHKFFDNKKDQSKIYIESGLILHQSITTSVNMAGLIEKSEPKMISAYVFDKWHKKLDQSVHSKLIRVYPQKLVLEYDDDIKLLTGVSIKKEFVKSYHQIATDMMISKYITSLINRIDWFFNETEFSTYSEDLLVQDPTK